MADTLVGQGYDSIGTRTNPGQIQTEFYNKLTGQAFANPDALSGYINQTYGQNTNAQNVFDILKTGDTPRTQALSQAKDDLNGYQNSLYNTPDQTSQRQSSSITDAITSGQSDYDTLMQEYNDLQAKLQALPAPNYEQAYTDLSNQQGIPKLNSDIGNIGEQRNDLPYVNRAASGNAGIETEDQLAADTAQKDVPLQVQQQNLINRLQLAQDFVNNSMKFKQMDADQARQSLTDAIGTAYQAIGLSQSHMNDLVQRQQQEQQLAQSAQNFAIQNGIDQPYYQVGNVIYDTATRTPKYVNNNGTIQSVDGKQAFSSPEQFFKDSGISSFDQIYHVNSTTMADKQAVLDLRQKYPDAGILGTDNYSTASTKLQNSRIYQDQVRPPASSGGGGGSKGSGASTTKYTAPSAASEIMSEWNKGYIQGNGTISSKDYKQAKEWWTSVGLSATSFDRQFGYLIDKSGQHWQSDYGYGEE